MHVPCRSIDFNTSKIYGTQRGLSSPESNLKRAISLILSHNSGYIEI